MIRQQFDEEQTQLVQRVFELTKDIAQAAAAQNWEQAERLAEERSPLLLCISGKQSPQSQELIRQLREIDESVARDAAQALSELTETHRRLQDDVEHAEEYVRVGLLTSVARAGATAVFPLPSRGDGSGMLGNDDGFDWL